MRVLLPLTLALSLAATALAAETAIPRTITVTGEGTAITVPDMATIRMGVVTEAPGAREAIDQNSRAMAAVIERLLALGIDERDMQTSDYAVNPVYSRSQAQGAEPVIRGFTARNMLTLRVRELARLGEVLDEVARDGANSFGGLSFGMQDPATARLGPNGAQPLRHRVSDLNRDGLGDLLLRFPIAQTGIACADTEATLTAGTFNGQEVTGMDAVLTVGCKKK